MRINMNTVISIESFLNKGGDLMDLNTVMKSFTWGFMIGLLFSLTRHSLQSGGTYVVSGIANGVAVYVVLGIVLIVIGLFLIHVIVTIIMNCLGLNE